MIYKVKWYINEDSTKEFFVEGMNLKEAKAKVYCQFEKFPSMLGNCLEFERVIEKKEEEMKSEREKLREMLDNMTPEEQVKIRIAVKQGLETAIKPEDLERLQKMTEKETDDYIWGLAKPNPRKKYKIYCDIKQLDLLIKLFNNDKPFVKMLKENRRKLIKNQTMNN